MSEDRLAGGVTNAEAGHTGLAPTLASSTGTPTLYTAIGGALSVMFTVLVVTLVFSPATLIDEVFIVAALGANLIGGFLLVRQIDERTGLSTRANEERLIA